MSKPRILPIIKGNEKASELFSSFSPTIATALVLLAPESFEVMDSLTPVDDGR
jgi:hypothetical protein